MKMYNSLTNHLNNNVNEGFDGFAKLFGSIGSIFGILSGEKENPITAELKKQMADRKKANETRLKDLKKSKEAAMLEKLRASAKAKERQLDLRNQDKINRYNALSQKFKRQGDVLSKTFTRFSDSELDAMEKRMESDYDALAGQTIPEGIEKARNIMIRILRDENGNLRENIQDYVKGEGKELFQELNDSLGTHFDDITKAMKDPAFKEVIDQWVSDSVDKTQLAGNKSKLEEEKSDYERKKKAVSKMKELNDAAEVVKGSLDQFDSLDLGEDAADNKEKIKTFITEATNGLEGDADAKIDAIKKKLESIGIPSDTINDIVGNTADSEKYLEAITNMDNEAFSEMVGKVKNKKTELTEKFNSMPYPKNPDHEGNNNIDDVDVRSAFDVYKEMEQEERDICGENDEATKKFESDLNKKITDIDDKIEAMNTSEENRKKAAQMIHKESRSQSAYEEFKHDIDEKVNELGPGESYDKDGNRGYIDYTKEPPKFVKMKDAEDIEQYQKDAQKALALAPIPTDETIKIIKKDGKFYMVENGEETEISKEEAKEQLIKNASIANQRTDILSAKTAIKDKILSMSKDKSPEEVEKMFNEMSDYEKEAFKRALNDPKEFFKDADDVDGLDKEIQNALGSDKANGLKDFLHDELDIKGKNWDNFNDDENDEDVKSSKHDDEDDMEDEASNDEDKNKQNPSKVWRRKTYKRGDKTFKTKNYYNKKGDVSITAKEYREKVSKFNKSNKNESLSSHLSNLLENKQMITKRLNDYINEAKIPTYTNDLEGITQFCEDCFYKNTTNYVVNSDLTITLTPVASQPKMNIMVINTGDLKEIPDFIKFSNCENIQLRISSESKIKEWVPNIIGKIKCIIMEDNKKIKRLDLSNCDTNEIVVKGCFVEEIIGGKGDELHISISKNRRLEKLDLSGYNTFRATSWLRNNPKLKVTDEILPKNYNPKTLYSEKNAE